MKKYGIFWILVDCIFLLESIVRICVAESTIYDYILLFFTAILLISWITDLIYKEIRIQKKLKEMREKEKTENEAESSG